MTSVRNDNLTHDEARSRSALLHVEDYDVHVDLTHAADPRREAFPVRATVRFTVAAEDPGAASTFIEYIHHSVDSVVLNGRKLPVREVVAGSRIRLEGLAEHNELTVHGWSAYSRSGEGLHRFLDPEDGRTYLYTQYEPADCRRVFPTFEQPDLKASFRFSVTAPSDWVVASNTPLESEREDPTDASVSRRTFAPTRRISTYITTILAGQYHAVGRRYRPSDQTLSSLPMTLYCRQAMAEHLPAEEILELTASGLDFFQELFDYPYPFPQYDQAFVPEYNLGAMENPGLVTFTENYLFPGGSTLAQREARANVIMHEMSHMWFGDLVTMAWWSDLWLKESFAEYMGALGAQRAGGFDEAWVSFAHGRKAWAYRQDSYSTTHPIVASIPDVEAAQQNFDGITYAKGASVLKQLVAHVGFERFIGAARRYFRRHEYGTGELQDFLAVLEEACGRDLTAWAAQWLQAPGVSRLVLSEDGDRLLQELPDGVEPEVGRPHTLEVSRYVRAEDRLEPRASAALEFPGGPVPQGIELDEDLLPDPEQDSLVLVNREDLTYALTAVPGNQIDVAVALGHTLEDPLDRAVLGGALWAMVRDGSLSPRRYLEHVLALLPEEPSATLLETSLDHAAQTLLDYVPAERRSPLLTEVAAGLLTALDEAEQGGDRQRILLRHALRLARQEASLLALARDVVSAFQGSPSGALWRGLALHDQMVWSARVALAAQGELDEAGIDRALRERTNQHAAIGAAQARAAVPDPAAKQAAWERIWSGGLSNDLLSATAAGYGSGPTALRRDRVEEYFSRLEDLWARESIGMASRVVRGLFPDLDARPDAARLAEEWLQHHPQAPTALRRLIQERSEDARRAAAIRAGHPRAADTAPGQL